MIITCPHCGSNYKIKGSLISKIGRKVKCFNCTNFWIQFPDGKFVQLKSEDSFSVELNRRQNLIRNSLNKKNIDINTTEHGNNSLSNVQEKELLSSLAITEIEQNRYNERYPLNNKNISISRVEFIRDKLNIKEGKNLASKKKIFNNSYLGFILVSIFFIICFIFYQKPEFFVGKNTQFEEELYLLVNYVEILLTNLTQFIEKIIDRIKIFQLS